ncbi:MlaA family lipoprotein [Pseudomonas sp. S9]|uniref:MlaA family lipoprotein n=1 Tax=Pseudomonas sp. S9 TaxID=686578 RepID=UPI000255726C|nr:VacJ family lipoprotein [Pseudomonas sp. S9]
MVKKILLLALLLSAKSAWAETTPPIGEDGFKNPLERLEFNPGLDQHVFEQSSFQALDVYDPWESINRRIYHFNYRFDEWVFIPVVDGYRWITPDFVESGVSNFFANIGDISNLANSLLQLKGKRSMDITARLLLNTTIGVLGVWDPATKMGIPKQREDFGQTLGYYGVPAGPYLMLPILGPSTLRDGTGLVADFEGLATLDFLDFFAFSFDSPQLEVSTLWAIDTRSTVNFRYGQLNSPFEYEKIRYFYTEARKLQINE